ncbi:hypothetical protein MLD38_027517 [Melastoma candidum]|uniref:Uncharacterized protein n=1 Tax=Melastoma candidum TaxID=119954 RepID=A0ACB9P1V3_9MYRT|nr:hypothetical protein MLD38_027517 [Melastoma candidum]
MQSSAKKRVRRRCEPPPPTPPVDPPGPVLDPEVFSALPRDALGHVFSLLPIKDSVRAGAVCRGFRHSWRHSRVLDFDQEFVVGLSWREQVDVINRVMTRHVGKEVRCFKLWKFDAGDVEEDLRRWIRIATAKKVEEIDLDFAQTARHTKFLHNCLDIKSLKVLKLFSCEVDFRRPLRGLQVLKTLVLNRVLIDEDVIDTIIGHCSHLETLELTFIRNLRQFKVLASDGSHLRVLKLSTCPEILRIILDVPTLTTFHYYGKLPELSLRNLTRLKDAVLIFIPPKGYLDHSLIKKNILPSVTRVEALTINSTFLEGISPKIEEDGRICGQKYKFENLVELQIHLDQGTYCNTHDITSFILKCPKLERLFIDFDYCSFESGVYWELHQKLEVERSPALVSLKMVKLMNVRFQKHQADLMKFLTTKAAKLERMAIFVPKWDRASPTTKEFCIPATGSCYDEFYKTLKLTSAEKFITYNQAEDDSKLQPLHSNWP